MHLCQLSLFNIIGNQGTHIVPLNNNTAISGGATAFNRQRHINVIGSLEKNTEVYFCNNYAHYFGIVIFILNDIGVSCSSRCFLLLLNAYYCCIIT